MVESTQHKLDRTRKPRVHITYDVETGGALEKKELPFVMGVLSDLSGQREEPLPKLKERGFVNVDRDNFDQFLERQKPRVAFKVSSKLTDDPDAELPVDITFDSMKDFTPDGVVEKVPQLAELMKVRRHLKSLQSRVTSSDELNEFLQDIISNADARQAVASELGIDAGGAAAPEPPAEAASEAASEATSEAATETDDEAGDEPGEEG